MTGRAAEPVSRSADLRFCLRSLDSASLSSAALSCTTTYPCQATPAHKLPSA